MKKFLAITLLTGIISAGILAFAPRTVNADFNGEWSLNKDKSDLGQFGDFAPYTLKIEQKDDAITISRTSRGFDGNEVSVSETLTFDGKEIETTLFGSSKKKASFKWNDDGNGFSEKYQLMLDFNGQMNEINGTESWALSEDGKTITLQNNSTSSFGDLSTKGIYEKK